MLQYIQAYPGLFSNNRFNPRFDGLYAYGQTTDPGLNDNLDIVNLMQADIFKNAGSGYTPLPAWGSYPSNDYTQLQSNGNTVGANAIESALGNAYTPTPGFAYLPTQAGFNLAS